MRRTDDASRSRRPPVRWEDDEITTRATQQSVAMTTSQPRSPLRPRPRHGWSMSAPSPSLSASATLSMYLSDALGGGHMPSLMAQSPLRREAQSRGDTMADVQVAQGQAKPSEPNGLDEIPGSPLSRFLRKRNETSVETPFRSFSTMSHPSGHRRATETGAQAASMERLLMEKIKEAKLMRETRTTSVHETNQENQRPNAVSQPSTLVPTVHDFSFSTVAPVPHPKPEKPRLPRSAIFMPTPKTNCPRSEPTSIPCTGSEVMLKSTRAARRIQNAWRRRVPRHRKGEAPVSQLHEEERQEWHTPCEETGVDLEAEVIATDIAPQVDQAEPSPDSSTISAIDSNSSQTDRLEEEDMIERESQAEELHARAVMWVDDECILLEEGRVPAFELLDPAALEINSSLEVLVRKTPQLVAEKQESERSRREQKLRAHRRQLKSYSHVIETTASTTAESLSPAPKQRRHVQVALHRRRRPLLSKSKGKKSRRTRDPSRVEPHHVEAEPTASDRVDTASQQRETEAEDAAARLMLDQLSRYVVSSKKEQHGQTPDDDRNDLIQVGEEAIEGGIPVDGGEFSQESDEGEEGDNACGVVASSGPSTSSDSRIQSQHSRKDDSAASSAGSYECSADHTLALFPRLRQTELEVKLTLDRIQAKYSLDQQRLIDAYADDAIFTTFFSPPTSPVDSDQQPALMVLPALTPSSVAPSEASYGSSTTFNTVKQQEFLQALDEFRESLRASMASTPRSQSTLVPTLEIQDSPSSADFQHEEEDREDHETSSTKSEDADVDVDAELQAMLVEIQRCKTQIAHARRQRPPPAQGF